MIYKYKEQVAVVQQSNNQRKRNNALTRFQLNHVKLRFESSSLKRSLFTVPHSSTNRKNLGLLLMNAEIKIQSSCLRFDPCKKKLINFALRNTNIIRLVSEISDIFDRFAFTCFSLIHSYKATATTCTSLEIVFISFQMKNSIITLIANVL